MSAAFMSALMGTFFFIWTQARQASEKTDLSLHDSPEQKRQEGPGNARGAPAGATRGLRA